MMRTIYMLLLLAWALWLGGLITLFIFARALFAHSRPVAISANPILFGVFERYQLVLAFLTLTLAVILALSRRSSGAVAVVVLVALATTAAVISSAVVTRKMQALNDAGQSSTPAFKKLHGQSMLLYTGSAVLLAGAAVLLPGVGAHPTAVTAPQPPR